MVTKDSKSVNKWYKKGFTNGKNVKQNKKIRKK